MLTARHNYAEFDDELQNAIRFEGRSRRERQSWPTPLSIRMRSNGLGRFCGEWMEKKPAPRSNPLSLVLSLFLRNLIESVVRHVVEKRVILPLEADTRHLQFMHVALDHPLDG